MKLDTISRLPSGASAPERPPRAVLVVDDSRAQRRILQMQLDRWGYDITEADSGDAALALCQSRRFDIILSDWMMPGMTGLEFCKAFRALPREGYGYFILLTSKSEKAEIADGLENGADDFLTKPVSADELRARLRAGERILGMQEELVAKNRLVGQTLGKLQDVYDSLDRDRIDARKLEQNLVRDRYRDYDRAMVSLLIHPSGHVGGDLVGSFRIDDRRIALYSVDVSGHGVAAAMMTARLAGLLSGSSPEQNVALRAPGDGARRSWPPEEVAARLNRMMIEDIQVDQYFTMVYAEIDLETGQGALVQAGHPYPAIIRRTGRIENIGEGGLPIGLIDDARYGATEFRLAPGERLVLVSDGFTECPGAVGDDLGAEGMTLLLGRNADLGSPALLEALVWDLSRFAGTARFPDDLSALILDYLGPV